MALFVKLWTDVLADPKLMRAARKGAKQLALLPWLLVFAKQADDGGRLTVNGEPAESIDLAAVIPGATPKQIDECVASLESLGVLLRDDDGLYFARWEERSGKPSDGKEAVNERVRKHRKMKRPVTPLDTIEETPCNALQLEKCNATEIEQELEQEKEPDQEQEQETTQLLPRAREVLGVNGQPLTDARNELVGWLGSGSGRLVDDFLDASPSATRFAWARGLIAMLDPPGTGKPVVPLALVTAMQDFLVADRERWPFAGRVFRAFIDDVNRPKPDRRQPDTIDALTRWALETDAKEKAS